MCSGAFGLLMIEVCTSNLTAWPLQDDGAAANGAENEQLHSRLFRLEAENSRLRTLVLHAPPRRAVV